MSRLNTSLDALETEVNDITLGQFSFDRDDDGEPRLRVDVDDTVLYGLPDDQRTDSASDHKDSDDDSNGSLGYGLPIRRADTEPDFEQFADRSPKHRSTNSEHAVNAAVIANAKMAIDEVKEQGARRESTASPSSPDSQVTRSTAEESVFRHIQENIEEITTKDHRRLHFADKWDELNLLLRRNSFPEQMPDRNCDPLMLDTFIEVLSEYEKRGELVQDYLSQGTFELPALSSAPHRTESTEKLEKEATRLEHMIKEKEQEMAELKRLHKQAHRRMEAVNDGLQQKVRHAKRQLNEKDEENQTLRDNLERELKRKEARHEKDLALFQKVFARHPRKTSTSDQEKLDVVSVFRKQHFKVQAELEQCQRKIKALTLQLRDYEKEYRRQFRERTSFTEDGDRAQNAKQANSPGTNGAAKQRPVLEQGPDQQDPAFLTLSKLRSERQQEEVDRVKDHYKAREAIFVAELKRQHEELKLVRAQLKNTEDKQANLEFEVESRPTVTEWRKAQNELYKLRKHVTNTKSLREMSKFVDTKELIKRDKDLHKLHLRKLEHLPQEVAVEILQDCCRELELTEVGLLLPSIKKLTLAVSAIPGMQRFIKDVCKEVHDISTARRAAAEGKPTQATDTEAVSTVDTLKGVLPTIRSWGQELQSVDGAGRFKAQVKQTLQHRVVQMQTDDDRELIKQIASLITSERVLLEAKETYSQARDMIAEKPDILSSRIVKHFMHLFEVNQLEGVFPRMNGVYVELNESLNALAEIRRILKIDPHCSVSHVVDSVKSFRASSPSLSVHSFRDDPSTNPAPASSAAVNRDIVRLVKSMLYVESAHQVVPALERSLDRLQKYDEVFPRLDSVVSSLFSTLGVSHLDDILPALQRRVSVS